MKAFYKIIVLAIILINNQEIVAQNKDSLNYYATQWCKHFDTLLTKNYKPSQEQQIFYNSCKGFNNLSNVHDSDIQWALKLENRVKTENHQPTKLETSRYETIAKKLAGGQQKTSYTPAAPSVSQQEIQWALQLEQKVNTSKYKPTKEETAAYQDIAKRLQASQSSTPTETGNQRNWSDWSKPFSTIDSTNNDIQWAIDILNKCKNNYTLTTDEQLKLFKIVALLNSTKP